MHTQESRDDEADDEFFAQHRDVAEGITRAFAVVARVAESSPCRERRMLLVGHVVMDPSTKLLFALRTEVARRQQGEADDHHDPSRELGDDELPAE